LSNLFNIVTIIQARTGSTRLHKKILLPINGEPLLLKLHERVSAAEYCGKIVIATTVLAYDDPIAELCRKNNIDFYRGHSTDLLDRHYKTAIKFNAEIVVKIPSDCPLIDPAIIDKVIKYYIDNHNKFDYVSNLHPASYPDGNDVEVMSINALKEAWLKAQRPLEREHTTPYFWENPDKFKIGNVEWETGLNYSMTHRFTIDYREDYLFIKKVYDELYIKNKIFSLDDILELLDRNPDLRKINEKYAGVNWYRNHLDELNTITPDQTKSIKES
jgi:spore coat polysaccharide biosynthesis protein SpsF